MTKSCHLYAGITIFFWSLAYILTKQALVHFSPGALGFLRYALAALVFVPFAWRPPRWCDLPLFMAAGACGFFLYMLAFNRGQALVSAAMASLIIATVPVMTAFLAALFFGERLKNSQWLGIAVEFCGVLLMSCLAGAAGGELTGIFWLFLASLLLSAYNLIQRRLVKKYRPMQAVAWSIYCGAGMLALYLPQAWRQLQDADVMQLLYLTGLGLGSSAIAYAAWTKAFALAARTAQVSNYMFFTPVLASFFGYLLGGEIPGYATLAGGAGVFAGMLIFGWQRRAGKRQA